MAASVICVPAAVPEQFPDQPEKLDPLAGLAVSVTTLLIASAVEHVLPHEIPAGLETTEPEPVPATPTYNVAVAGGGGGVAATAAKLAVQLTFCDSTPVNVAAMPLQTPDQPLNVDPLAATAESVMLALTGKLATHVLPQEMPVGKVVTVPMPVPDLLIVRL
ncbi:MAG: hypothetical protein JNN20_06945 [Betaproteobacteria bacterium]|nr:hypothetical protein [Betaproteobacteria bacterium]